MPEPSPRRNMEKKVYETPQVLFLGSVQELTALTCETNCSVVCDDLSTADEGCEIPF
jgi:hypothetical protein